MDGCLNVFIDRRTGFFHDCAPNLCDTFNKKCWFLGLNTFPFCRFSADKTFYRLKNDKNTKNANIYVPASPPVNNETMDEKTRVQKDIVMFEENIKQINQNTLTDNQKKTIELATQYYEDTKYYTNKKDYFTAFGCINYAHGLLDAILKTHQ
jgi:uncharacterized protein